MPIKLVVDASALAALLFGEPEAPDVVERLGDSALVAPTLFSYEIANICWKKLRRHPDKRAALREAYSLLGRMEIEEVEVSMAEVLLLADRENLTAYDASYLWLSRKLGLELVTLDGDLKAAAAAAASRELPL
ncbi:MAG TPA: type II toxin-antitoxin system VapC family toxin [Thermoanaerobaculia bacterium]|jgi:predicted nucleic acid-binding protein|nr:type II toxin-antitoxin system VapC family toxin [Thermoanaerobaculia bacterium]